MCHAGVASTRPHRLSRPPWSLGTCGGCGSVYLLNPPTDLSLENELAWEKSIAEERARRRKGRALHYALSDPMKALKKAGRGPGVRVKERRLIERYVESGPILDLGCGDGRTMTGLSHGYVPFGVEISPTLAAEAEASFGPRGGRVVRAPAFEGLDGFERTFFSGAMLRAYLEHETRPMPVLRRLLTKLRPGGRVIIKVPNFASWNRRVAGRRWCGLRFPDHVNYFTPTTLRRLVTTAGFEVSAFGLGLRLPTSDNMWLVAARPADSVADA